MKSLLFLRLKKLEISCFSTKFKKRSLQNGAHSRCCCTLSPSLNSWMFGLLGRLELLTPVPAGSSWRIVSPAPVETSWYLQWHSAGKSRHVREAQARYSARCGGTGVSAVPRWSYATAPSGFHMQPQSKALKKQTEMEPKISKNLAGFIWFPPWPWISHAGYRVASILPGSSGPRAAAYRRGALLQWQAGPARRAEGWESDTRDLRLCSGADGGLWAATKLVTAKENWTSIDGWSFLVLRVAMTIQHLSNP